MKRIHAFEFEDLKWFPKRLRDYGTDFLEAGATAFDVYKHITPLLSKGIGASETNTIIDLGSGGGGGWKRMALRLQYEQVDVKIILTDQYPNIVAFEKIRQLLPGLVAYAHYAVDARNVPSALRGFRTLFFSFHHFKPCDAKAVLQNAIDAGEAIGIFEAQQRDVKNLILRLFSPLNVLLMTPFIRPVTIGRLLFTYLIPIVPLFVLWDGIISVLRTYTERELQEMISQLKNHELFNWEVGTSKNGPVKITYLLGLPKNRKTLRTNSTS